VIFEFIIIINTNYGCLSNVTKLIPKLFRGKKNPSLDGRNEHDDGDIHTPATTKTRRDRNVVVGDGGRDGALADGVVGLRR